MPRKSSVDRQNIELGDTSTQRKGGWVRFGDQIEGGAQQEEQGERPLLADFIEPAIKAGAGVHLKNLYNDYIYFFRWALWRLFEKQACGGIVTFITASSYLGGPGFVGVREMMRREFDEIRILNLGGDNIGTRKTPNVFNIQTPVAIVIGFRSGSPSRSTAAKAFYTRIEAETRNENLKILDGIEKLTDLQWEELDSDLHSTFYPKRPHKYFSWPELSDLFPWQHSGAQFKRTWPISEDSGVLLRRWDTLRISSAAERKKFFKETRDRKIENTYRDFKGADLLSISALSNSHEAPPIIPYCYRQFDIQSVFLDNRVGDYIRPPLVKALGPKSIFFSSLITKMLGKGSAIGVSADLPDLDVFCGRGGKDIIPLYRDGEGIQPNITDGLLDRLSTTYGFVVTSEDFAAYVYATLGGQSYTARFWNELETPGPRVPLTKKGTLFSATSALGRRLIWLHTYAKRFRGDDQGNSVPTGSAKNVGAIPSGSDNYPVEFSYDIEKQEVSVGKGRFGPVKPEVWEFEVSGLKVVQSWLAYRMKVRAGKKSSPLDNVRPQSWTPRMTDELLELLWVIEATLATEPDLSKALDAVVADSCFTAEELPEPTEASRKPPETKVEEGPLFSFMEGSNLEDDDEE